MCCSHGGRSGTDGNARGGNRTTRAMQPFWAGLKLRQYKNNLVKRLERNARKSCVCKWAHGVVSAYTVRRLYGNRYLQLAKSLKIQQIVRMSSIHDECHSCHPDHWESGEDHQLSHDGPCLTEDAPGLPALVVRASCTGLESVSQQVSWNCCHRHCRV